MNPEEDSRTIAAVKQSVYYRNYRRARDRALVRLAQSNPEEYRRLFLEERRRDEENDTTWSHSGSTIIAPNDSKSAARSRTVLRRIEAGKYESGGSDS